MNDLIDRLYNGFLLRDLIGYAVPGFLLAIFLIVLFAGGSFWNVFPLRGLHSDDWLQLPWYRQVTDYFWHLTLPLLKESR